MRKLALDCDGLLCDFTSGTLRVVEEVTGRKYESSDIGAFDICASLGLSVEETAEVWSIIGARRGFVAALQPYAHARQGVRRLRALGHVFCVTAPFDENPWWRQERDSWLALHFGIDVVHHLDDKSAVDADVLVDDRSKHVRAWLDRHPGGTAVLWRTLHNMTEEVPAGAYVTSSWDELYRIAAIAVGQTQLQAVAP